MGSQTELRRLELIDIPLERDGFLRSLVRHLSGVLEDLVGLPEATGFVSLVGQNVGDEINASYRRALHATGGLSVTGSLSREQLAAVLVDLKRRIQGDFYIAEETDDRIIFGNRRCPFGEHVLDRPALCMMTSNVFGRIASENLGYAKVDIEKSLAQHDPECRIVLYLNPTAGAGATSGREYVKG